MLRSWQFISIIKALIAWAVPTVSAHPGDKSSPSSFLTSHLSSRSIAGPLINIQSTVQTDGEINRVMPISSHYSKFQTGDAIAGDLQKQNEIFNKYQNDRWNNITVTSPND